MASRQRVAVVGYGNVGKACVEAVITSSDLELAGIVRRQKAPIAEFPNIPVVTEAEIDELGTLGGALIASPTRKVADVAERLLSRGISTADSFDIHGTPLLELRSRLDSVAKASSAASVISAGWDPGTDSMIRAIMELAAPRGLTFTNFGPGMSMGHSTAAKAIPGVKNAVSFTFPKGEGAHRRLVYIELEPGAEFEKVKADILADTYFSKDETRIEEIDDVTRLMDMGHGVVIERKGISGQVHNQQFRFEMRVQNPALTAQVMVSSLRAALRQRPGCYTLLELPLVDFLPGDREVWLRKLV